MSNDDVRMLSELAPPRIDDDQLHTLLARCAFEDGGGDGEAPAERVATELAIALVTPP